MPVNILFALQLAQAAGVVIKDIVDAVKTATSEGRDLTGEELAALVDRQKAADALAEAEAARLRA